MGDPNASLALSNLSPVFLPEESSPFRTLLSEFIYVRTYSRWVDEIGRRETWDETVARYIAFLKEERPFVPADVLQAAHASIRSLETLPSMRALWSAGEAARRDNTTMYNCAFVPLDSIPAFAEVLYILMCGTGIGFSVEREFVNNLPVVAPLTGKTIPYTIADSTEGWADALKFVLTQSFLGNKVDLDYSGLRRRGAVLKTKGGRASGPEPLERLLNLCSELILSASGRQLRPIECHDIACAIGDIVHVGGFRRAALISFSDPDDEEMRHAKDWSRGSFPTIRYMANNTSFYAERPTEESFWTEWRALVASRSGERGFFRMPPAKRATRKGDYRLNPCGEIGLRFTKSTDPWTGEGGSGSFCNLTAAVMRADDTRESMAEKIRVATWVGAIQATFTHFPYLRKGWAEICTEDRLLGVDITGQCDNPALSDNIETMSYFNWVARHTAAEASRVLGINMPAAITCGKPSGNSSQLVDCASGFHPRYARYYLRRVRIDGKDPLTALLRDSGVPMHKENGMGHLPDAEVPVWVVEFPVKSPDTAMVRDSETAVEMCERYLRVMQSWCGERGHNQSATIYVRDHEWEELGKWVYAHFDEITGLSFLPYDGGSYTLAPYEEITAEQYARASAMMPEVDFSLLTAYERDDRGNGATELACMGGSCEV